MKVISKHEREGRNPFKTHGKDTTWLYILLHPGGSIIALLDRAIRNEMSSN